MIAAPPAYAPSSDADLAARVTAAESNPSYQAAEWIDEHPVEYVALVAIAVHTSVEAVAALAEALNTNTDPPLNGQGEPYPQVIDPRTGEPIPYPENAEWTLPEDRTPRDSNYRDNYKDEWAERGYPEPDGGWDEYVIHHIEPLEYGGDNSFENGVPVTRPDHELFNDFWRGMPKPR